MTDLETLRTDARSRRTFLKVMGAAGLGFAAHQLLISPPQTFAETPGVPPDGTAQFAGIPGINQNTKVLNFALTLEFLEADLYRQALNLASGYALTRALSSNSNEYSRKVSPGGNFTSAEANEGYLYLKQFTYVEAAHRDFLRTALGSRATTANPKGYKFVKAPGANVRSILETILPLEETGVRAYLGALPYLKDLNLAQVAGTIFSTEARHSAAIAYQLGLNPSPKPQPGDLKVTPNYPSPNTFEYYLEPSDVVQAAKAYFA